MVPRSVSAGVAVALLATGMTMASTTTSTAADAKAAAAGTTPTHFAFNASGYGTRLVGGQIPAGSDRTAYQLIACTNQAGKNKTNYAATVDLGNGGLTASAVRTTVWTTQKNGVASSWALNKILKVQLGSGLQPTARINGIVSKSRAYHNGSGFHSYTKTSVASISLDANGTLPGGVQSFPVPTQGNPVEILGLIKISLGPKSTSHNSSGASARGDALKIEVLATGTVLYLAHSRATIHNGVVSGLFNGQAYAAKVSALDEAVRTGKIPFIIMPCQGTNGVVQKNDTALVNPQGLVISGLSVKQRSDQAKNSAYGWELGRVAKLNVGSGQIVAKAVVGKANVHWVRGKGFTTDIKGSTLGTLTVNDTPQTFPPSDVINIPGVVKLERNIVHRTKRSIEVTALRVTLLSGSLAVIDLGHAKVGFSQSF